MTQTNCWFANYIFKIHRSNYYTHTMYMCTFLLSSILCSNMAQKTGDLAIYTERNKNNEYKIYMYEYKIYGEKSIPMIAL